ncbi:MAG: Fur family transcriptional regulator [Devosia marina]|uniref:Fur family transcriptional regulator n=1 Tax=Devosia marina TaxID=2683198 RepID=UPI0032ED0F33
MAGTTDVNTLVQECRALGLKATENLRAVLAALADGARHPDVEELRRAVEARGHRIALASVYRVVAQLTRAGIVETRHFETGKSRYELARGQTHDHLVDIDTGDILDFHDAAMDAIEERVAAKLGYRIVRRRVELYAVRMEPRASLPLTGDGGKDEAT